MKQSMEWGDPVRGATPGRRQPRVRRRAAELFAAEPELIVACLEGSGAGCGENAQRVLASALDALALRSGYADLHYYAAHAALAAEQPALALELLHTALRINPSYDAALILAARIRATQGKHEEATRHLEEVLAQGADYPDVHLMLGDLWQTRRDLPRARAAYRRALQLNSNFAAAAERMARVGAAGGTDGLPA